MPINFIEQWAERNPDRRWPWVYALLLVLIVLGCAVAPDPYDEPLTIADVKAECRRVHGPEFTIFKTTDGDIACRRGRSA